MVKAGVAQLVEHPDGHREGRKFIEGNMFVTYILYSESGDRYYIGHSENLEMRLSYHNEGRVKSTRGYRPWKVVYFEEFSTKLEANRRELEIKKKKSRKYIEFLILK